MFNFTAGALRRRIEVDQATALQKAGVLIRDDRRRRPYYFDGRFLTARDLTREQNYFLARQTELGRATGSGVITGLQVGLQGSGALRIEPGHGITSSGEMVTLTDPLPIQLADVAESQDLDARFGVSAKPRPPARNRSGVFIIALRPVEFTANPIASYPQSLTGPRTVQDGEIVEAAAVTLIPYADESSPAEIARQQARIARDVFVFRGELHPPVNALPLAMVSVSRGTVNWLDVFLVRREVGAEHGDTLGLGFAPRALREAHFLQYREHLEAIMAQRRAGNQAPRFAASEYFYALPPVGPMPAAAVDTSAFSQVYFPPGIDVEMGVIPEDELRMLVEDALLLPPIDLTLRTQDLESTGVLVLAAVPRSEFHLLQAGVQLGASAQPAPPPVPKLLAGRRPLELLSALTLRNQALPVELKQITADDRWRNALARLQSRDSGTGGPLLWYVRRRNFTPKPELASRAMRPSGDDVRREALLQQLLAQQPALPARWAAFRAGATTVGGLAATIEALAQNKYQGKLLSFLTAFQLFERAGNEANARRIAVQLGDPKFGDGLHKFTGSAIAGNANLPVFLAAHPRLVEFDQLLQTSDDAKIAIAVAKLATALANQASFATQVNTWLDARGIS